MEFKELDRQFDAALDRLKKKFAAGSGATSHDPLAGDHLILQKSWEYFRARIKELDEQWREIIAAKGEEAEALKKQAAAFKGRMEELGVENQALREFEAVIKKTRAEDHAAFQKDSEKLRVSWEAEREALERNLSQVRFRLERAEKTAQEAAEEAEKRRQELLAAVDSLKRERAEQAERILEIQRRAERTVLGEAEKVRGLEAKIAVLQSEIDGQAGRIANKQEEAGEQAREAARLSQKILDFKAALAEKERELEHLKMSMEILGREKAAMRERWDQEKAEWRELWDRARDLGEKKKSG